MTANKSMRPAFCTENSPCLFNVDSTLRVWPMAEYSALPSWKSPPAAEIPNVAAADRAVGWIVIGPGHIQVGAGALKRPFKIRGHVWREGLSPPVTPGNGVGFAVKP